MPTPSNVKAAAAAAASAAATPAPQPHASSASLISEILDQVLHSPALLHDLCTIRKNQQSHEEAWYKARNLITERYAQKRALNAMLSSIGGAEGLEDAEITRGEIDELRRFDTKLRLAMADMYTSQQREVRALGIGTVKDEEEMGKVYRVLDELLDSHESTQTASM